MVLLLSDQIRSHTQITFDTLYNCKRGRGGRVTTVYAAGASQCSMTVNSWVNCVAGLLLGPRGTRIYFSPPCSRAQRGGTRLSMGGRNYVP